MSLSNKKVQACLCLVILWCGCIAVAEENSDERVRLDRPEKWAKPLSNPDLPNLNQVKPWLYRGTQPETEGFKALHEMGIKTIINLRANHSDKEEFGELPFRYEQIPINTWNLEYTHVLRFFQIVSDPTARPVFLHCLHGADRTGTMSAMTRIIYDGWTKEEAMLEMTEGGFGYHTLWKNIPEFIQAFDVEKLKADLANLEKALLQKDS